MTLELATARYADFTPAMGVPCATSLGRPKWPLRYELSEEVRRLMPWGLLGADLTEAEFTARYRARLDRVGVQALRRSFYAIANRHPGKRLCLLCFENVLVEPAAFCHRRVWATWWEDNTGQVVPELSPMGSLVSAQLALCYEIPNDRKGQP